MIQSISRRLERPETFEEKIALFEQEAQEKYTSALSLLCLCDEKPANWFLHILNRRILPQLLQIGFDGQLSRTLFQIAIHSWQQMGWTVDDCLWIHPSLTKNIEEVRKGILKKAEEKNTQTTLADM